MGNSIYLGGGLKSAFCGGNVKEIWQGSNKIFGGGGGEKVHIGERDYPFVKIGNRLWTSLNLLENTSGSVLYNNSEENGRYYPWNSVDGNVTPLLSDGWRIPNNEDVNDFFSIVGRQPSDLTKVLKDGTNETGFSLILAGDYQGSWQFVGTRAYFAMSTKNGSRFNTMAFYSASASGINDWSSSSYKFNIRVCKDA